eukprot:gb/GEZN01008276.1/.p1 GENE.gb/GEZN01008276.1/~~gb/GEZN01008276.1/.p1  ORF type:complete len:407 (-),score=50.79 gb/GEZN01008276.1/:111-1331(-)
MPNLLRQPSYFGVSLPELGVRLAEAMTAAKVSVQLLPVRPEARQLVDRTVAHLMGVLVKHNLLTRTALDWLDTPKRGAPDARLIRVWKTANKIRHWLLSQSQAIRSGLSEQEETEARPEHTYLGIYQALCSQVRRRCRYLLRVVPVRPDGSEDNEDGLGQDQLSDHSEQPTALMSQTQQRARDTLLAWQSRRGRTLGLRHASSAQRFTLVWKLVLSFLSADGLDLSALSRALRVRRGQTILRTAGLEALIALMDTAKGLSSVELELVSSVPFALQPSDRVTLAGSAAAPLFGLRGAGRDLTTKLQKTLAQLFFRLIVICYNRINTPGGSWNGFCIVFRCVMVHLNSKWQWICQSTLPYNYSWPSILLGTSRKNNRPGTKPLPLPLLPLLLPPSLLFPRPQEVYRDG